MISAKNLSDEQQSAVKEWAREGSQLADIQKRLKGQFGLNVTYMDTRLLVLDLGIEIQIEVTSESEDDSEETDLESSAEAAPGSPESEQPVPSGGLQVTTDEMVRAGAIVSGTVIFSDGEKAIWMIDEMGRPGLEPDTEGYQPSEEDLIEFEKHLRMLLEE